MSLTRRRFIQASAAAATSVWTASNFAASGADPPPLPDATASRLPRWRGFNLLEKFIAHVLELWRDAGWGWAMWNLRGPFGPVDSGRNDVAYEERRGLKIDRAMLDLIRAH